MGMNRRLKYDKAEVFSIPSLPQRTKFFGAPRAQLFRAYEASSLKNMNPKDEDIFGTSAELKYS